MNESFQWLLPEQQRETSRER